LNHLDFYLWEHLKPLCIQLSVHNSGTLHQHTVNVCQTIHNHLEISKQIWQSISMYYASWRTFWTLLGNGCFKCCNSEGEHLWIHTDTNSFSFSDMWSSYAKFVHTFQIHGAHPQSLSTYFRFILYNITFWSWHAYLSFQTVLIWCLFNEKKSGKE
jgi:hypothetical protein